MDQIPSCSLFPDGSCGCYCEPRDIGGPGCGGLTVGSRTLVVGADREPQLADQQLLFDLDNAGNRREGAFIFEEWALVSSAGGEVTVLNASTASSGPVCRASPGASCRSGRSPPPSS